MMKSWQDSCLLTKSSVWLVEEHSLSQGKHLIVFIYYFVIKASLRLLSYIMRRLPLNLTPLIPYATLYSAIKSLGCIFWLQTQLGHWFISFPLLFFLLLFKAIVLHYWALSESARWCVVPASSFKPDSAVCIFLPFIQINHYSDTMESQTTFCPHK